MSFWRETLFRSRVTTFFYLKIVCELLFESANPQMHLHIHPRKHTSLFKYVSILTTRPFNSSLTHLSLRNNRIGEEGARLIGSTLSTSNSANKTLLHLNLAFNSIGDAGAVHIAQVYYKYMPFFKHPAFD